MAKVKFIRCSDGGFLYLKNITRLFLAGDTITQGCSVKASVIGPAMPFVVADYENRLEAEASLQALVDLVEGED